LIDKYPLIRTLVIAAALPNAAPESVRPAFNPQRPPALFIGRYQPFHGGHRRLIEEGLRRVGQVCIAVRNTQGVDDKNPLPFFAVKQRIETALSVYTGRFTVAPLPNITNVLYGRNVGYAVERIVLDETIEAISATNMRRLATAPRPADERHSDGTPHHQPLLPLDVN
jgi:cytidyltransferase-like protein